MARLGHHLADPAVLAGILALAGCAVAPPGVDYGYGPPPGYYGYGYEPGFYAPGSPEVFCCFPDEDRHHEHHHEIPQGNAVANHPAASRTTASGSSMPHPVAAPSAHASAGNAAIHAGGGAAPGHASGGTVEEHSGGGTSGSSGLVRHE
jgi:hypothetical protein